MTRYGTHYFPTLAHAIRYHADYENNPRAAVATKLHEGSIKLGQPELRDGQRAWIEDNRWFIEESE